MTAEVCISSSVKVWTSDRLSRSEDGKASGFDWVVIVFAEVSTCLLDCALAKMAAHYHEEDIPLHFAPQTSQVRVVCCRPLLLSSKLPQSVQKTREPIADIFGLVRCK